MMDDLYVECLVARRTNPAGILLRGITYGLTALFVLGGLFINTIFFFGAILGALAVYFVLPLLSVEYEYLYVSKTLTVDKIFSKEKRKNAAEYDLEKMEIFAEEGAYQLDDYKNMKVVSKDYSSGIPDRKRWVMIVRRDSDVERIILEPNEEMIAAFKNQFPGKTFSK